MKRFIPQSILILIGIAFVLAKASSSLAQTRPANSPRGSICLLEALVKLEKSAAPGVERAVELEIAADRVWSYLTTEDGTLRPLVSHYGHEWFEELFGNQNPANIAWSSLSASRQRQVLNRATLNQKFFEDRRIRGILIRQDTPHPLRGFQSYVEFGSPGDPGNIQGVELHLRSSESASALALRARQASLDLGQANQHLHVHIPIPRRGALLQAEPQLESLKRIDFYRRTELQTQMMTIMETNVNLAPDIENGVSNFARLNLFDFTIAYDRILDNAISHSTTEIIQPAHTKGYMGIRGPGSYDDPELWGIEVRAIHRSLSNSVVTNLLNGFEATSVSPHFGLPTLDWSAWARRNNVRLDADTVNLLSNNFESPNRQIAGYLYPSNNPRDILQGTIFSDSASPVLKERTQGILRELINQWQKVLSPWGLMDDSGDFAIGVNNSLILNEYIKTNPQVHFLFHNWRRDPLFFNDPGGLLRIDEARLSALRKIQRGEPVQEVMREFLIDSELYQRFSESLGVQVNVLTP